MSKIINEIPKERYELLKLVISWRDSLKEGRPRLDRYHKLPFIRDSLEERQFIVKIDELLANELLPSWNEIGKDDKVF